MFAELTQLFDENILVLLLLPAAFGFFALLQKFRLTILSKTTGIVRIPDRIKYYVVVGKSGVITRGQPQVTEIIPSPQTPFDQGRVLKIAASVSQGIEHPISKNLVDRALREGFHLSKARQARWLPGLGVEASLAGRRVQVGNRKLMEEKLVKIDTLQERSINLQRQGKTVLYVAYDGEFIGLIALSDPVRSDFQALLQRFFKQSIPVMLVTGDHKETANWFAAALGIDRLISEISPQQKASEIRRLLREDRKVVMIGEGASDQAALAAADFGFNFSSVLQDAETDDLQKRSGRG